MEVPGATSSADLALAPASDQIDAIRQRRLSVRELTELHLERIEQLNPQLNAFRKVMAESALAEADRVQARVDAGEQAPLLGLPVAIKDDIDVEGEFTAYGTRAARPVAERDCELVRRLRVAGVVILGKTNLPELAAWPFTESKTWGVTRNPWNPQHTPGGSSGGSAAAVASGMAAIGNADDGGGSIRIPASNCNLFGLKPQRGRVSLAPLPSVWHGLSASGCVSRTVLDTALYLDAVSGPAEGDAIRLPEPERPYVECARTAPGNLRIAVSTKPIQPGPVDDQVKRAVDQTATLLGGLGHRVTRKDPPWGLQLPSFLPRYLRGLHEDAQRTASTEVLERRTRVLAGFGARVPDRLLARAHRNEIKHVDRFAKFFTDYDVLLMPVLSRPPERVGRWQGKGALYTINSVARYMPFTTPWNMTGQPAASVPAGFSSDGLPIGVQVISRPNEEGTLLSLAAQIESQRPWIDQRPPVS